MLTITYVYDILLSEKEIKTMIKEKDETQFLFRFPTTETRRAFKLQAVLANKSMTELLGDLVTQYLQDKKEVA